MSQILSFFLIDIIITSVTPFQSPSSQLTPPARSRSMDIGEGQRWHERSDVHVRFYPTARNRTGLPQSPHVDDHEGGGGAEVGFDRSRMYSWSRRSCLRLWARRDGQHQEAKTRDKDTRTHISNRRLPCTVRNCSPRTCIQSTPS